MSTDQTQRQSPLHGFFNSVDAAAQPDDAVVNISERPFLGHLNLRGDPGDERFTNAVASVLGFTPPTEPNTVASTGDTKALWLGPDEWLIVTPPDRQAEVANSLNDALGETHPSVTDVTGGQTVVTVSGPRARDVLAKGCPLDLHPTVFGQSQCAQTLVAKANVTIRYVDDTPTFDLIVRRSFADYLATWLHDAALEYGPGVVHRR